MKFAEVFRFLRLMVFAGGLSGNVASADKLPPLELIAHRGASFDAPENTLAALELGWAQTADAGEIDVRLSGDGQVVLMHDVTTRRTAGREEAVATQTLARLRELDVGAWKSARWAGERVPTLAEALATVPTGKKLFVEIKSGPEILPALGAVLEKAKGVRSVLIGFDRETMREAKQRWPALEAYWVVAAPKDSAKAGEVTVTNLIALASEAGLDGLDLDARFTLDAAAVAEVRAAGLKLYVWTVDDPARAKELLIAGVDGITTNRPGFLRAHLFPEGGR